MACVFTKIKIAWQVNFWDFSKHFKTKYLLQKDYHLSVSEIQPYYRCTYHFAILENEFKKYLRT